MFMGQEHRVRMVREQLPEQGEIQVQAFTYLSLGIFDFGVYLWPPAC